ncbi:ornithine cyclodeaminase family protein [Devosia nitrariae]|uniref:Alanine dehydrogenase n=1 Tax=Devosia nitrariae TaxID=2071872 RepID=A0ABQ5WCG1_9HYPH|nr:ornithine cyclodeaminase family protein [Devosia nitrariae]GLQ57789.1 alanine dehydrogenase [Devosia nitrariae]
MTTILTDDDLFSPALMPAAIEAVESALKARAAGNFVSPPRHAVAFGNRGELHFTTGGSLADAGHAGFRVYDTFAGGGTHTQIVAVWSLGSAELECIVLGSRLGEIRTGAIGGVAIRHMSAPDAETVGIIGSGRQARMQLEAAAAVRRLRSVRVFSPNPANRERFAKEMGERLNLSIQPVAAARDAVDDVEIVICATTSRSHVLEAGWLRPDAHVSTVGPKTVDGHEIGLDVAEWARTIATDSPEQTQAYRPQFFLDGSRHSKRIADLSRLLDGSLRTRSYRNESTLFCSVGLAGTEVLVAAALLPLIGT